MMMNCETEEEDVNDVLSFKNLSLKTIYLYTNESDNKCQNCIEKQRSTIRSFRKDARFTHSTTSWKQPMHHLKLFPSLQL